MTYDHSNLILSLTALSNQIEAMKALSELIPIDDSTHHLIRALSESQTLAYNTVFKEALALVSSLEGSSKLPDEEIPIVRPVERH